MYNNSRNTNMVKSNKNSEHVNPEVSELINSLNSISFGKITIKDIKFDLNQTEKFTEG